MSPHIEIRSALAPDRDAITACASLAYTPYIARMGRKPAPMVADFGALIRAGHVDVLIADDQLRGYVVHYPNGDHVHLENIAVDPATQGNGWGRMLIAHVEEDARRKGFERVELYTNARMTQNLDLYPRLGYRQFDRRLEDGFDRVYFEKALVGEPGSSGC